MVSCSRFGRSVRDITRYLWALILVGLVLGCAGRESTASPGPTASPALQCGDLSTDICAAAEVAVVREVHRQRTERVVSVSLSSSTHCPNPPGTPEACLVPSPPPGFDEWIAGALVELEGATDQVFLNVARGPEGLQGVVIATPSPPASHSVTGS